MRSRIKDRGKVFRDPVHRLIRVEAGDDFILDLIDTREFQRLRRIRQLGVSWLTYHGAEHSRFSHSLGVFNFAQRILRSLMDRYKSNSELAGYLKNNAKELKAAALLHDIGHAPFSHVLERAFAESPEHERTTIDLIRAPNGDIASKLNEAGVDPNKVAEIIQKTSKELLIVDIVSSQLDADRMDYLLRDALHTGVEYGRYDSEWVIRNLCIGKDPSSSTTASDGNEFARYRLCLDRDRGLHSAEQLILARLHMTMQVYMHRVTRGYEVLLLNMFRLAVKLAAGQMLPEGTPELVHRYFATKGALSAEQWLRFDETVMYAAFAAWADAPGDEHRELKKMAHAFLWRQHIYGSREIDREKLGLDRSFKLAGALGQIGEQGVVWELDEPKVLPYKGLLYAASRPRDDRTKEDEREEQSSESILLATGELGAQAVPVETASRIFQTLDFKGQSIERVYYDLDRAGDIEPVLDAHGVHNEQ